MKPIVYFFGTISGRLVSYPEDHTRAFFTNFIKKAKHISQIVLHREDNLLYYGYVRRFSPNYNYLGICLCIDCVYKDMKHMFSVFDSIFADMVQQGDILKISSNSQIEWSMDSFFSEEVAVAEYSKKILDSINLSEQNILVLPPVDFSMSIDKCLDISLGNDSGLIADAIKRYCNLYIVKTNSEIARVTSFQNLVKGKNVEIQKLNSRLTEKKQQISELKTKYSKLNEQKRQYKKVVVLCILTVACGIGLFFLKDSLDSTRDNLVDARNDIVQKDGNIKKLNKKITALQTSLSEEKQWRKKLENTITEFKNYMPVMITDVEIANTYKGGDIETDYGEDIYSSRSMYLKPRIVYKGIKTGENIMLSVKLYAPSGLRRSSSSPSDCTFMDSLYVYGGSNIESLSCWGSKSKGFWKSGTYRYEVWYGDVCLKAKTFTIH